jgi:hypothetical protein
MKLIMITRDPVERGVSQLKFMSSKSQIPANSDEVATEIVTYCKTDKIIQMWGALQNPMTPPGLYPRSDTHRIGSVCHRGRYDVQIAAVLNFFSGEQLLVIDYKTLLEEWDEQLKKLCVFLSISVRKLIRIHRNKGPRGSTYSGAHEALRAYYDSHPLCAGFYPH